MLLSLPPRSMCRLYGLQATHPTRPACELLVAQNALIHQSREDARGHSNPHGWGIGYVHDHTTSCFRQVAPAAGSADYRTESLRAEGTTVLAHVRRATVGNPAYNNTHPFRHGGALLIHNGHVPAFDRVRPRLLDRLDASHQQSIRGITDSEHVLALLLQLRDEAPNAPLDTITRRALALVQDWVTTASDTATVDAVDADTTALSHDALTDLLGLNLLWTDGTTLAGSRLNRTLWARTRTAPCDCPICGHTHAAPPAEADYRSTTLASERLTDEDWIPVPNGSVFRGAPDGTLHCTTPSTL
jgi:glutamine amidotransferase